MPYLEFRGKNRTPFRSRSSRIPYVPVQLGPISVYGWGRNSWGQIGDGTRTDKSSPTQVSSTNTWIKVTNGNNQGFGIASDGSLWAWGAGNTYGALGDGTILDKSTPIMIGALTDWSILMRPSSSHSGGAAIKTDGTLWTWGANDNGQLGDNSVVNKSSPIKIGTLTDWKSISVGSSSIAIKTDGTIWTWGANASGQLGLGNITDTSSPQRVGSLTDWLMVSNCGAFAVAIKTDGTLWTWGANDNGQLGDGSIISKSSPIKVGALTTWNWVHAGDFTIMATQTDGTLWCWGRNLQGVIGDGTTVDKSSPVKIGSLTNWNGGLRGSGGSHVGMVKTDGTLWTWGDASNGCLGDETTTSKSSPVIVGNKTDWYHFGAGYRFSISLRRDYV